MEKGATTFGIMTLSIKTLSTMTFNVITPRKNATFGIMEQHSLKNVNNYLNTYIYSYLETSGVQSYVFQFFNTSVN